MYRLTALLLLLFLFACSKNPVDIKDQQKATGKIAIVCTYSPSVTAKVALATERAEITFWKNTDTPGTSPLVRVGSSTTFESINGGVEVVVGTYFVNVKGYDVNNKMTYYGSVSNVVVEENQTKTVTIDLVRPGIVSLHTGINFVSIPAGSFQMGDEYGDIWSASSPAHSVTISAFNMSMTEITQGQYFAIMGNYPSYYHDNPRISTDDNLPVENVTWDEAVAFCTNMGPSFRLPTEAEWEYACRAGSTTKYNLGNTETDLARASWYSANSENKTHWVGQKTPNAWGLYDMHGNVFEWCQDWYGDVYTTASITNPTGPSSGTQRVFRGSGYYYDAFLSMSARRDHYDPSYAQKFVGFRVVVGTPKIAIKSDFPTY